MRRTRERGSATERNGARERESLLYGVRRWKPRERESFDGELDYNRRSLSELGCSLLTASEVRGPTSYSPVIEAAIDIVEKSGGQYHVLVIIADGQVTRSINLSDRELSAQEEKTITSIVNASAYPLSIVLVGVGDGPWDDMKKFDDKIPARDFDNFQFVNFTDIMSKSATTSEKEAAFALAALMEIPFQYKAAIELRILGNVKGNAQKLVPRPPPIRYNSTQTHRPGNIAEAQDAPSQMVCPICLTNGKDLAFGCGHTTCTECGSRLSSCPICRQPIRNRLKLYTG